MTDDSTGLEDFLDGTDIDADDVPTFEAPWQARAFGLAVALQDREDRDWKEFHRRFVRRINEVDPASMQADVEGTYYERWLESLETLLLEEGLVTEDELVRRQAEFSEGDRDAAEFVLDP